MNSLMIHVSVTLDSGLLLPPYASWQENSCKQRPQQQAGQTLCAQHAWQYLRLGSNTQHTQVQLEHSRQH
jgi:hypothetical protein